MYTLFPRHLSRPCRSSPRVPIDKKVLRVYFLVPHEDTDVIHEGEQYMKRVGIIGTGSYLPEKVLSNFEMEKFLDTSDEWIMTRTGIRERRAEPGRVEAS